jgi:hypothetical protein
MLGHDGQRIEGKKVARVGVSTGRQIQHQVSKSVDNFDSSDYRSTQTNTGISARCKLSRILSTANSLTPCQSAGCMSKIRQEAEFMPNVQIPTLQIFLWRLRRQKNLFHFGNH